MIKCSELAKFEQRKEVLDIRAGFEKKAFNYKDVLRNPDRKTGNPDTSGNNPPVYERWMDTPMGGISLSNLGQGMAGSFASGVGQSLASAGISAIGNTLSGIGKTIKSRLILNKQREKVVDAILKNDPIVSVFEESNPGSALENYATMASIAPTLSLDKNVVTSFLRNTSQSGGPLDFATVKLLAEAEKAVNAARNPERR